MSGRLVAVAAVLVCLLTGSCTSAGSPGTGSGTSEEHFGSIDVSTPQLRRLKAAAGVAACRPGRSSGQLPEVTLPCLGGGRDVDLARLRGPLVINLFAQWCPPCRGELPYYQELHQKGRGQLSVLGVDYQDSQPAAALQLAKRTGVTYPLLADSAGRLRAGLGVTRGLPGVVFVDRAGKVTSVQFRVVSSYAELRGLVRQQLGITLPA